MAILVLWNLVLPTELSDLVLPKVNHNVPFVQAYIVLDKM